MSWRRLCGAVTIIRPARTSSSTRAQFVVKQRARNFYLTEGPGDTHGAFDHHWPDRFARDLRLLLSRQQVLQPSAIERRFNQQLRELVVLRVTLFQDCASDTIILPNVAFQL